MTIDPPAHARCLGFKVSLRELMLSLDEPDRFIEAFGPRRPPGLQQED